MIHVNMCDVLPRKMYGANIVRNAPMVNCADEGRNKWGFVSTTPGALLHVTFNSVMPGSQGNDMTSVSFLTMMFRIHSSMSLICHFSALDPKSCDLHTGPCCLFINIHTDGGGADSVSVVALKGWIDVCLRPINFPTITLARHPVSSMYASPGAFRFHVPQINLRCSSPGATAGISKQQMVPRPQRL